jgi:hypothetical protein
MLPYLPAIAIASLLLLAVPVYLPRFGLAFTVALVGLAVFFFVKPPPPPTQFTWGLDRPLGIIITLYAALWVGTALVSLTRDRQASTASLTGSPA